MVFSSRTGSPQQNQQHPSSEPAHQSGHEPSFVPIPASTCSGAQDQFAHTQQQMAADNQHHQGQAGGSSGGTIDHQYSLRDVLVHAGVPGVIGINYVSLCVAHNDLFFFRPKLITVPRHTLAWCLPLLLLIF